MRAFVVPSVFVVGFVVSTAACLSPEEPTTGDSTTNSVTQPVIGGSVDTAAGNNAVVQLESNGGRCTGTVFQKTGSTTWILTAAHCVPTQRVYIGPDSDSPIAEYNVAETIADARYGEGEGQFSLDYDIALVRVGTSISEVTPIELVGAADGLAVGTGVTSYGYGNTTGYEANDNNTQRRSIDRTVALLTASTLTYDQGDQRGICAGDSGGPVVLGTGAARRVVGVHSTVGNTPGQEQCFGQANSIRVAARHDFIDAAMAGTALPQLGACEACIEGANDTSVCRQKRTACQNDPDCADLAQCLRQGGGEPCINQFAAGLGPYLDYYECGCSDACTTQCSGQPVCAQTAKCGVAFTSATRTQCIETNCCAEADAAAADGLGYQCLERASTAGCATNAKYQAYAACAAEHCDRKSSSSSSSSGDVVEEEPEEEPQPEAETTTKKSKKDDAGGCSVSTTGAPLSGGSPAALLLALCVGAVARARRSRA